MEDIVLLQEELKKTKMELSRVNKETDDAYNELDKISRILRVSLMEIEEERNELERVNRKLEKSNRAKSDFLAAVSHELKTPLTCIKAFGETLLYKKTSPHEMREFLEIINDESDRLIRLINNLLSLSKIEKDSISGKSKLEMKFISINKIINVSLVIMKQIIKKKGVKIDVEISKSLPYIYGNYDKLIEVLINLLDNAVKFTNQHGKIKVSAVQKKIEDTTSGNDKFEIWVSVNNTGIGIAKEKQREIFEKFYQIKSDILTNKPEGIGLGLSICKEIIRCHNGTIWVQSTPETGSTFTFSLPVLTAK